MKILSSRSSFVLAVVVAISLLFAGCGGGSSSRAVIQNKGSDTLVNVAQAWAEHYKIVNPNVAIAISGGGSGTGISALINGTVDIANSSRRLKEKEIEMAHTHGVDPVEHIVGYDALAIFLHADNPLDAMTIEQLRDIYGEGGKIESWSQLGVENTKCESDEIVRISRQNNSGTYAYFKKAVLGDAEYKLGSRDMHGSKDVEDIVGRTPCAIGYSGLAYATDHIKLPCIRTAESEECVTPTVESAADRSYPIARPLLMYTPGEPTGAVKEYLDWVLSDEGQCILKKKGYAPVRQLTCP